MYEKRSVNVYLNLLICKFNWSNDGYILHKIEKETLDFLMINGDNQLSITQLFIAWKEQSACS